MMQRMLNLLKGFKEADDDPVKEYYKNGGNKSNICVYNAQEVTDFSSQYGSEMSISYSAHNLAGKGNIYPNYGDFTQACVFRTYGPWWDIAPSRCAPFPGTPASFCSQDYIELSFQSKVYPIKLEIYETYNPGCIVRILACERSDDTNVDTGHNVNCWKTLWSGEPALPSLKSRMFCPPLKKCSFATDLIRLELCHEKVDYYTELDYVVLYGSTTATEPGESQTISKECLVTDGDGDHTTQVTSTFEKLSLQPKSGSPVKQVHILDDRELLQDGTESSAGSSIDQDTISRRGEPVIQDSELLTGSQVDDIRFTRKTSLENQASEEPESDNGMFDLLPEECIQLILSFLDLLSLCRVAQTSSLLQKHSYDSLQYTELNLQPHWTQVNDVALDGLQQRSRFLQRLNLSWCHGNILSNDAFRRYLHECGQNLRCLYLSSCNFVDAESLDQIAISCPNLSELDLGSCQLLSTGFSCLSHLKRLERLNLYRSRIREPDLVEIIRNCRELRHLNLGSSNIQMMDEILKELGSNTSHLISLDLWRCRSVTHNGLLALANGCPQLQELDIGWCTEVKSTTECIINLVHKCTHLKKLFLTANRTVCDADLYAIASHCPDLEQLDILGTRQVSEEASIRVLESCKKMKFFDVSFCSGIDNSAVARFRQLYPHCAIKKSFQN